MLSRYRRLLNLFAFSVLAFAIYLNFFNSEERKPSIRTNPPREQQSGIGGSTTPASTASTKTVASIKQEGKN